MTWDQLGAVAAQTLPLADYTRILAGAVPVWQGVLAAAAVAGGAVLLGAAALPAVRRRVMPAEEETRLADLLPFAEPLEDGTIIRCKDGSLVSAIEIAGLDLAAADRQERELKRLRRQAFWTEMDAEVQVRVFSWKQRIDLNDSMGDWPNARVEAVGRSWFEAFAAVYSVRHVVVLSVGGASDKARTRLDAARDRVLEQLQPFGPRVLGNGADQESDLLNFWAHIVNPANSGRVGAAPRGRRGRFSLQAAEDAGLAPELVERLQAQGHFSARLNHRLVGGSVEVEPDGLVVFSAGAGSERYGHWVVVPMWNDQSTDRMVAELLHIDGELMILHRVRTLPNDSATRVVNDSAANAQADRDDISVEMQAAIARQRLSPAAQQRQALAMYELAVLALGRSPEEARKLARRIAQVQREFLMRPRLAESDDAQELYFGQFPTYDAMRRDCGMFSSNLADVIVFENVTEGLGECDWWPEPILLFKTVQGTVFRFCPHEAAGKERLAHVVVIGRPGSGKTKLAQLFCTMASRIPGFRATVLDRDYQSFPWSLGVEAQYFTLHGDSAGVRGARLNPLQLDLADPDNRDHLLTWFGLLTGLSDPESTAIFGRAVELAGRLPHPERSLQLMVDTVFPPGSRAAAAIRQWVDANQRGHVFASGGESLSLDARVSVFNMTRILEDPGLAAPVVADMWHRHRAAVKAAGTPPNMFWVDEARALLPSPLMRELIVRELREKRRQRESVWLLFQEPTAPAEFGPEFLATIRASCPTQILFPNEDSSAADWAHWQLSEREIRFVTGELRTALRYPALIRQPGVSVIVELDQAPLGDAERFFRGGGEFVGAAFEARAAFPADGGRAAEEYLARATQIDLGAYQRRRRARRATQGAEA